MTTADLMRSTAYAAVAAGAFTLAAVAAYVWAGRQIDAALTCEGRHE